MKRVLIPGALAVAVFCITFLVQRYTFICQEYNGLFLLTPDYFRQVFRDPLPVSRLIGSFLVQFYRFSIYAPLIFAAILTGIFLLLRAILRTLGLEADLPAAAGACTAWYFSALADSPATGIAILLGLCILLPVSRLLRPKTRKKLHPLPDIAASLLVIGACTLLLCLSGKVRDKENLARLEHGAAYGDWDLILRTATPEETLELPHELPYALLALARQGRLGDRMFSYPVQGPEDFLDEGEETFEAYLLRSVLYESLGCANESIHQLYQSTTYLPFNTSFLTLRRLIQAYCATGEYALARKYCEILSRSTLHGQYIRFFDETLEKGTAREPDPPEHSAVEPLVSTSLSYNIARIEAAGIHSPISSHVFLCLLLAEPDLDLFVKALENSGTPRERLPVHYQEALVLAGADSGLVSDEIRSRYASFMSDLVSLRPDQVRARYGNTFWYYNILHIGNNQ